MRMWYLALLLLLIGIVAATSPSDLTNGSSEGENAAAVIEKPPTSEADDKENSESSEEGLKLDEVNQEFEEFPESSPEELSNEAGGNDSSVSVAPIESKTETTGVQDVERKDGDEELEEVEEHPELEDWSSEESDDADIVAPEENGGDKPNPPASTDLSTTNSDASAEKNERIDSEVEEKPKEEDEVEETEEQPEVEDWSSEEGDDAESKPTVNEESEEQTEEQPELPDEHAEEEEVNQNENEVGKSAAGEEKVPEEELDGNVEIEEAENKTSEEGIENQKVDNAGTENEESAEVEEEEDASSDDKKKDEQEIVEKEPSKETNNVNEIEEESETAEESANENASEVQEGPEAGSNVVQPPENVPNDDFDVREKIIEHALKEFEELVEKENGEVEETVSTSVTPAEEVAVEEQTPVTEVTDGAKVSPRAITHADIRAAMIAEAEKAFKIVIQEEEKVDVAEELRSEPKLAESEEKEIKQLMSNALGEKEEAVVETEEKAEEDEIIKNLTRRRRATKETPVELPTETKDETGKNETLPAAIEKDAPRVETKRQEAAKAKFTDGLGWIHYPWKTYPILKKRFHYERQCGCEVMWIKRVYTRPRPKSNLLLVHSVAVNHRRSPTRTKAHCVHNVKRHRKAPKPCKRRSTGSPAHRAVSRRLAELSWSNRVTKTKSAAREGRLIYKKRQKKSPRRRRCNKKKTN